MASPSHDSFLKKGVVGFDQSADSSPEFDLSGGDGGIELKQVEMSLL